MSAGPPNQPPSWPGQSPGGSPGASQPFGEMLPGQPPGGGYDSRYFAPPTGFSGQPMPPPPPPRRNNLPWLLIGGVAAAVLLCCCVVGVLVVAVNGLALGGLAWGAASETRVAQRAADDYFAAIRDHDWARAYNALDTRTRATTSTAALQRSWTAREAGNGRVGSFSATSTSANSTNGVSTATVTGTLRYDGGTSEAKTVLLVKENGVWKLSALP